MASGIPEGWHPKVGDVLERRWEIVKKLGQGAFGAVYEVSDKNNGNNQGACKVSVILNNFFNWFTLIKFNFRLNTYKRWCTYWNGKCSLWKRWPNEERNIRRISWIAVGVRKAIIIFSAWQWSVQIWRNFEKIYRNRPTIASRCGPACTSESKRWKDWENCTMPGKIFFEFLLFIFFIFTRFPFLVTCIATSSRRTFASGVRRRLDACTCSIWEWFDNGANRTDKFIRLEKSPLSEAISNTHRSTLYVKTNRPVATICGRGFINWSRWPSVVCHGRRG